MKKLMILICLPVVSLTAFAGEDKDYGQEDNRGAWAMATTSPEVNHATLRIHDPVGSFGQAIQPNEPEDLTLVPHCPASDWGRATSGDPDCH